MRQTATGAITRRALRPTAYGLLVVVAAIVGSLVHQAASSSASAFREAPSITDVPRDGRSPSTEDDGAAIEDDGALPQGVTVLDNAYPGVANLDPDLLRALREAATDAAHDGIELYINSGWRSPGYQDQLLREAISRYGTEAEAARWVATADTSPHVSGDAVDIGQFDAITWLSERGAEYGLCQIYRNEAWHFELRSEAVDRGCPPMYANPTHDPRMQR